MSTDPITLDANWIGWTGNDGRRQAVNLDRVEWIGVAASGPPAMALILTSGQSFAIECESPESLIEQIALHARRDEP